MTKKTGNIFLVTIIFLTLGCAEKPTEPIKEKIVTSKRDYVWTVDTLYYVLGGQVLLQSIWGSSPTNVYAVGHDAHGGIATMWHYDGNKWSRVGLLPFYGGRIEGPFDLQAVYGFDSTNIYAVGERMHQTFSDKPPYYLDSSFIVHFDGTTWDEVNIKRNAGSLNRIDASSPTNIWCSGRKEYVYNYDGFVWTPDSIPFYHKDSSVYEISNNAILLDRNRVPMLFSTIYKTNDGLQIFKFFKQKEYTWLMIDSFTNKSDFKWGISSLWKDNEGTIYSAGDAVYRFIDENWSIIYRPQYHLTNLWGTNKNNIFASAILGHMYHFNGIDWAELNIPVSNNINFWGSWGTEQEIFITAYDGEKSYIFHGK